MRSQRHHSRLLPVPFSRLRNCLWVISLLLVCAICWAPRALAQQDVWTGVQRIVAIGDVHGDYQQLVALLRQARLIDQKNRWIGGTTHLVQLGDVPDRGTESRKSIELLMSLEKEAAKAGGHVHALIGNHEAMNMYGDLRYVPPKEFEAYRTRNSKELRQYYYEQEIERAKKSSASEELPKFDDRYKKDWESKHPLGFIEQRQAFNSQGSFGKWILGHNAIIKINNTVFLHGGISPKYAGSSIQEINQKLRAELADFSKLEGGIVLDDQGPLWYRGLALDDESALTSHVEAVLEHYGARRIVLGHTLTQGTVIPRFQGKVLLADAGLTAVYGARLAGLILEGDAAYVLHRGKKYTIPTDSGPLFLQYLKQAAALDPAPSPLQDLIRQTEEKTAVPAAR
ncbi:MAG: metallophosphoesterase [Acidobacteria bacterium]|nr:metallophosphoesterase [Acidobacteriota bacterium]